MPKPGGVPKRTEKRAAPQDFFPDTPAPHDYKVTHDGEIGHKLHNKAPAYTIRLKISDPAMKEKRPGAQTYHLAGNVTCQGVQNMPKWTMPPRDSAITKPNGQPGPGEYPIPGTIYGGHPAFATPGRVPITTQKRTVPTAPGMGVYPSR